MSYYVDNQAFNKSKGKYEQTWCFLTGVCARGIYAEWESRPQAMGNENPLIAPGKGVI